jgi:hypothetical protein
MHTLAKIGLKKVIIEARTLTVIMSGAICRQAIKVFSAEAKC